MPWTVVDEPARGLFVRVLVNGQVEWRGDVEQAAIAFWRAVQRRDPTCGMEVFDEAGTIFIARPDGHLGWRTSLPPRTQTFLQSAARTRDLVCR